MEFSNREEVKEIWNKYFHPSFGKYLNFKVKRLTKSKDIVGDGIDGWCWFHPYRSRKPTIEIKIREDIIVDSDTIKIILLHEVGHYMAYINEWKFNFNKMCSKYNIIRSEIFAWRWAKKLALPIFHFQTKTDKQFFEKLRRLRTLGLSIYREREENREK